MYKNCHIAFTIFCTLITLAGCRKEGGVTERHPINMEMSVYATTKSRPLANDNLRNVNVEAYRTNGNELYFKDVLTKDEATGSFDFPNVHWWIPDVPLDFYCHTCGNENNVSIDHANKSISFDYSISDFRNVDEILAGFSFGKQYDPMTNGTVNMGMRHTMSLIEFQVGYEVVDGQMQSKIGKDIIITAIGVSVGNSISSSGKCTVTENSTTWNNVAAVEQEWIIETFNGGNGLKVGTDINAGDLINSAGHTQSFILIPGQTLSKIQISFIEGTPEPYTKSIDINPIVLKAGERYLFSIAIKSNEASVSGTSITDWISSGSTSITVS